MSVGLHFKERAHNAKNGPSSRYRPWSNIYPLRQQSNVNAAGGASPKCWAGDTGFKDRAHMYSNRRFVRCFNTGGIPMILPSLWHSLVGVFIRPDRNMSFESRQQLELFIVHSRPSGDCQEGYRTRQAKVCTPTGDIKGYYLASGFKDGCKDLQTN